MPVRRRIPKESENRIPKSIEERHTGESLEISSRFCHIFPMAPLAAKNALPPKIESWLQGQKIKLAPAAAL